jgi:long-chain acyl-CoA synthetase
LVDEESLHLQPLIQLLDARMRDSPRAIAVRAKRLGLWEETTWGRLGDLVSRLAAGLASRGVGEGAVFGIISETTREVLALDLACQALGALSFPIHPSTPLDELQQEISEANVLGLAIGNPEILDRLRGRIKLAASNVQFAVMMESKAVWPEAEVQTLTLADLERAGAESLVQLEWSALVSQRTPDIPIALHATSGSSGKPHLATVSSASLLAAWSEFFERWRPTPWDRYVVELPISHLAGRAAMLLLPLRHGTVLHFPEHRDALIDAMVEVTPTISIALPATWKSRASEVHGRIDQSGRLRRRICELSLAKRRESMRPDIAARSTKMLGALGWWCVLRPIRRKLGLHQVRTAWIGGAHVSPDLVDFWRTLGVPLAEFYSLTEGSGLVAFEDVLAHPSRAGLQPIDAITLSVAESGELRVKSIGAGNLLPTSANVVRAETWIATGDVVELSRDKTLRIKCRLTDMVNVNGEAIQLVEIERMLQRNRLIRRAAVVGAGRAYLSALVELDFQGIAAWARANSVRYGSVGSLATAPKVVELVAGAVSQSNQVLANRGVPPVQEFAILPASSGFEQSELVGTTGEIRRAEISKRFAVLIESMYSSERSEVQTSPRQQQGD